MTTFTIYTIGTNETILFAAQELLKYLKRMTGSSGKIRPRLAYDPGAKGLWLGLVQDIPGMALPRLESELDDALVVEVEGGTGRIVGANPRSLLLGVYRFLHTLGCRWLRPKAEGEWIPHRALEQMTVRLAEQPSYRHRAICIEGAVSLENVLDIIDWAPKVGFSGYFHQFREGHTFFERWYSHQYNPFKTPEQCPVERARQFTRQIERELARRGMVYHAIGHGWTCEAFGIPGLGWEPVVQDWPDEVTQALAEVNGQRAMWQDIPLITSLCFSNPQVRARVVKCVVEYLETHHNIQALHFWLDDGFNNKCECEHCRQMRPSDFYIVLLNELDEALTRKGFTEKVVFLSYADMLWAPEVERLKNPNRFILMFAPITRSYRKPLFPSNLQVQEPPYERNRLVFSNNNDEQLAFLRAWQATFTGDSFIYDYHMWRPGTYTIDPDHLFLARLLSTDIKNLHKLGLNGMVSCQILRIFFPTGMGMYVMGRTLWDEALSFDALMDEYFPAAFGTDWALCKEYLLALSELQDVVPVHEVELDIHPQAEERLAQGLERIRQFTPVIERNLALPDLCQARSWHYLQVHAGILERWLNILAARARGDQEEARRRWKSLREMVQRAEDDLQPVLDVYAFVSEYEKRF